MANSNQHQAFGFGVRPQFTNEAPAPLPAGNAGSALGVMMTINGGDLLDVLPPEAREKVETMRLRHDELSALYRSGFEEEQAVRIGIFRIEQRIRELKMPRGQGGPDLDDDDLRVTSEQKRLDRARADLARLIVAQAPRNAESQLLGRLIVNIDQAIAARPAGTIGAMVEIEVPAVKDALVAVETKRRRMRELSADLQRVRCAPYPSVDRKRAMVEQVEKLAAIGAPDASSSIEHGEDIRWPTETHRIEVHNADGAVGFTEQPNTLALLAWLFEAEIVQKLDALISEVSDDDAALTAEQRAAQMAEIERDILATEFEEIALIEIARKRGHVVAPRADTDVRALLQIAWVPAPPPAAREGVGEAGLARTIGP